MIRLELPNKNYKESHFKLIQEFYENNEDIIPAAMILKEW